LHVVTLVNLASAKLYLFVNKLAFAVVYNSNPLCSKVIDVDFLHAPTLMSALFTM
jgi:hypothetical protein